MTNSLLYQPTKGKHYPEKKQINFPGQCGDSHFDYNFFWNTMYLENQLGAKLVAKKTNCNRIDDYKTELSIDFLKLKTLRKDSINRKYLHESLNENINIGYNKKTNLIAVETNRSSNVKSLYFLDSFSYKAEPNYADEDIPFISYVITPDKNIVAKDFNEVLKRLKKSGQKKIYIRTLKDSFSVKQRDIFEYIRIKENHFNFDSEKTLQEIIN